ncbi:MAG: VanZ family protein [Herbinix sp.]|nr:VanZ family protein [Herbinix sp.]
MKRQNKKRLTKAGWLLFYLYIIILSYFLFFSEHYGRENVMKEYHYNLEFFKEIKRFIKYRELLGFESFVVNILGNILAFAPFGFLLPLLKIKYRKFFYTTFLCLLFSVSVELVQLLLKVGIFDVDDIMMNTTGGIIGYVSFMIFNLLLRIFKPRSNIKSFESTKTRGGN